MHRPTNLLDRQPGTAVLLLASALAALPTSVYPEELKPGGVDTRSLEEVRWLSELPIALAAAIGRQQPGREGIADVKEQFNSAGLGSSPLPLRRFIVGGVSVRSALLAYELGGSDYRAHRYRASTYLMARSRWTQTGEWTLFGYPITLAQLTRDISRLSDRLQPIFLTPPVRGDGPLREANLSDEEVREIQAAAHGIVTDARWWLDFESLHEHWKDYSWTAFSAAQQKLQERFPACTGKAPATAATSPPSRAAQ